MNRIILFPIFNLFFLCFIINEEIFVTAKELYSPLIGAKVSLSHILETASAVDPRIHPEKFCDSKCTPSLIPPPGTSVDFKADAKALNDAVSGSGTKEHKIIDILTRRGVLQRLQIAQVFANTKKGYTLPYWLRTDISGAFEISIMAVMMPVPVLLARDIRNSITPSGTDHQVMVETFCSISNHGIKSTADFYKILYNVDLDFDVKKDTSGTLQKVLVSLAQGKRDGTQNADNAKVVADAQALNGAGAKPWNAKPAFADILGTRNNAHLRQLFIEYKKISGHEIDVDIKKQFPGPEGEGLLDMVKCARAKAKYFAEKLDEILRTKKNLAFDTPMIRILVSRSEIDLGDIKVEYEKMYKKSLHSSIEKKTGGDYRRVLTNMILGIPPAAPPKASGK